MNILPILILAAILAGFIKYAVNRYDKSKKKSKNI